LRSEVALRYGRSVKTRTVLTPDDWADAALYSAAEVGLGAVRIEALARRLGVSKGSFYWHFTGLDELLRAACVRWENAATDETIIALEGIAEPRRRLEALLAVSVDRLDHLKVEAAIAAAAGRGDRHARPVYARVTRRRLEYVEGLYRELGSTPAEARSWAWLTFGTYLGTVQLASLGFGSEKTLSTHVRFLTSQLVPAAGTKKTRSRGQR
jgi:AcrR family transcriptional regulator